MKDSRVAYFEPHTLKLLNQAFRTSWAIAYGPGYSLATRQQLAQRIMSCASSGETNLQVLVAFALTGIDLDRRAPQPPLRGPLNYREAA